MLAEVAEMMVDDAEELRDIIEEIDNLAVGPTDGTQA